MSTPTRQKNIETIINFSRYLEARGSKSFLPDITDKVDLPSVAPDFDLDSLKFEISLDGQGYELKDVFNNIVPNEQTPYIFLIQGGNFFAKIYEQSEFPKEWLHPNTKTEGIFFRLQTSKEKDFNEIIWSREFVPLPCFKVLGHANTVFHFFFRCAASRSAAATTTAACAPSPAEGPTGCTSISRVGGTSLIGHVNCVGSFFC